MSDETKLAMLKISLGITTTAYDTRLTQMIQAAEEELEREGVTLSDESISDGNLVVQYAEWMWRKRDSGEGMPRMLRWAINCRLFEMESDSDG